MTIKVSKPSINLREKLSELDFDKVPFQKMPAGSVVSFDSGLYTGYDIATSSTSFVEVSSMLRLTIKPKAVGNKIVMMYTGGMPNKHSGTSGMTFYSWASISGSTVNDFVKASNNYGITGFGDGMGATDHPTAGVSMTYTHTVSSLDEVVLSPVFRSGNGTISRATEAGANQHITVWAMEVQS